MAAKKYRMLKAGEVVLPTDEVYVGAPVNTWLCGSLNCGKELPAQYEGGYRRLDIKEAGRTVRAKRPVQQRKVDICPKCKGEGWVRLRSNGNYSVDCPSCGGSGKRSTVA